MTRSLIKPRSPISRTSYSDWPSATIFDPLEDAPACSTPFPRKRKMSSDSDSRDGKRRRSRRQDDGSLLKEIKALVQGSGERTVSKFNEKIDIFSDKLTKRMDASELDVKKLGRNLKELKGKVVTLASQAEQDRTELSGVVSNIVDDKIVALKLTRLRPKARPTSEDQRADKYYEARRIWLLIYLSDDIVRDFLVSKLGTTQERADELSFKSKCLTSSR